MKPTRLHHINRCPGGYLVRIRRQGVQRQAFRTALSAALAIRDEFFVGLPIECPRPSFNTKAHSNTGYVGICETYKLSRGKIKYPCFAVSWAEAPMKNRTRFFRFDSPRSRAQAMRDAITFRSAMVEERLRRDRAERTATRRSADRRV